MRRSLPSLCAVLTVCWACGEDGAADAYTGTNLDTNSDTNSDTSATTDTEKTHYALPGPTALGPQKRRAKLLLPASYDATKDLPVIFLLGGYDYFAADLDDWFALSKRVNSGGFALVLPDGQVDKAGSPYWNATDTCCDFDDTSVDDVGYLLGLLDELADKVRIDSERVTVVGHSAGGFMAFRLACEATTRFSAVVSIAVAGFLDASMCKATAALSVLQVHGEKDDVMPIDGDDGAPGAVTMLQRWAERGECDAKTWGILPGKLDHADDGINAETTVFGHSEACKKPVDVRFWRMSGNDHYPEFRPVFTDNLLSWALAQKRP